MANFKPLIVTWIMSRQALRSPREFYHVISYSFGEDLILKPKIIKIKIATVRPYKDRNTISLL